VKAASYLPICSASGFRWQTAIISGGRTVDIQHISGCKESRVNLLTNPSIYSRECSSTVKRTWKRLSFLKFKS